MSSAKELDGASVCVQAGTTTELNLADYFRSNNLSTTRSYSRTTTRSTRPTRPAAATCSPPTSRASTRRASSSATSTSTSSCPRSSPRSPWVRPSGRATAPGRTSVRWSLYAMIQGEEFGITSANVDQIKADNKNPDIARFLGTSDELGKGLGLPNDFAYQVVEAGRQLWRQLRAQCRHEHLAQDRARRRTRSGARAASCTRCRSAERRRRAGAGRTRSRPFAAP